VKILTRASLSGLSSLPRLEALSLRVLYGTRVNSPAQELPEANIMCRNAHSAGDFPEAARMVARVDGTASDLLR